VLAHEARQARDDVAHGKAGRRPDPEAPLQRTVPPDQVVRLIQGGQNGVQAIEIVRPGFRQFYGMGAADEECGPEVFF